MIERGVRELDVFFIDDNHFSFALFNTLRSDQGKAQEALESADDQHPLVQEIRTFIREANEIDAENGEQEANFFGYREDLPPGELAQIANSLRLIYGKIRPGDPAKVENSYRLLKLHFFSSERYDLSEVGRIKLNYKFMLDTPESHTTLTKVDIIEMIRYIMALRDDNRELYRAEWTTNEEGEVNREFTQISINVDDIDHLGNRRVRAVGELLENQFRNGLMRMERTIKDRLTPREDDKRGLRKLINPKPVVAVVKEYFGSSQLSQFMDQTNPLSEVTHKRRLSALGPGGLSRDRAGFEVRDVHMTHYGRICPIETPEGPNIGLISSLSTFAQINRHGFIETPYRKVKHFDAEGKPYKLGESEGPVRSRVMLDEPIEYFNALHEEYREDIWETSPHKYNGFQHVAQAKVSTDDDGWLLNSQINVRASGDFLMISPTELNLVDVAPNQLVSVAASLIPFLENDDANRALMGSNMQRQAVPLLVARSPLVGTGIEYTVGRDSGVTVVAQCDGVVHSVDANRIVIIPNHSKDDVFVEPEVHHLVKFRRSNQNTCISQRPIVERGDWVKKGDVIADGPSTEQGELALGQNVVVAFMPWGGYNFEDSILISERLVQEDVYTSIHIEEFDCSARDTKLGPEEITKDISSVSEEACAKLDDSGIIRVGSEVRADDILVGKTTPKGETQQTPEEKLLRAIFGHKAEDVRDSSLRVRTGVVGTVIGVKVFGRADQDMKTDKDKRVELAEETKLRQESDARLEIIRSTISAKLRELCLGLKASSVIRDADSDVILRKGETITDDKLEQITDEQLFNIRIPGDDRIRQLKLNLKAKEEEVKDDHKAKIIKLQKGDDLPTGVKKMVKVYVAIKRKLQVGDKMAGRHGNKGVISRVLPIEDMPFLEDGTPVEMVLNPLGVPSRMNIGQILETHLGWAARGLGKKINRMVQEGALEDALRD
jgi:DNA-directed RNA polymerase subunit beta